jgi:hypothetical protein
MNLCEVQERLHADDEGKWDLLLEREEMRMQEGRLRFPRLYRADHPTGLALTRWAQTQLCQRLSIPTAYYRRCPLRLQDDQVNYWLHQETEATANERVEQAQEKPERWLLRAKEDTLRGILSERYAKMNNADVFQSLEPLVKERYEVAWLALTEESWHLRLVDPGMAREVLPGDRLVAGLHIANSEVGKRSVTVDALVYRLVCSNGLVRLVKGRSLLHQRHVGITPARLEMAIARAIKEAIVQGTGFMERMLWATREPIPDVEKAVETMGETWGLSETVQAQVTTALLRETRSQQETLYGLVNAFTNVAQTLLPDERYTLEALAGHLLERGMPDVERSGSPTRSRERPAVTLFEDDVLSA